MKIKDGHRRDFWAYYRFNRLINGRFGNPSYFCPDPYIFNKGDGNTLKCFVEYESTGKMKYAPKQPSLLKLVFDGKKLLNFHIEQWVEGLVDGILVRADLETYLVWLPAWVREAINNQWTRETIKRLRLSK